MDPLTPPRILHVSRMDHTGGAGRAALRLHTGLRRHGWDSWIYVEDSLSGDPNVIRFQPRRNPFSALARWKRRKEAEDRFRIYAKRRDGFPVAHFEAFNDIRSVWGAETVRAMPRADLVNLHWVTNFIDLEAFFSRITVPVAWRIADMNLFTGGCHYDDGCGRFNSQCGSCPQLLSSVEEDLSRNIWLRKSAMFEKIPADRIHFVALNQWMAGLLRNSALVGKFPVTIIPNGLDTDFFRPLDKTEARRQLGIPPEVTVILFVAASLKSRRKGFAALSRALEGVRAENTMLVSVGEQFAPLSSSLPHLHLGHLSDNARLASVYSAGDLFVSAALQDNLPNTVLEAMSCGLPIAGFSAGGVPDMVVHGENGLLSEPGDIEGLRASIQRLLDEPDLRRTMAERSRQRILEKHTLKVQASAYGNLYREMLGLS